MENHGKLGQNSQSLVGIPTQNLPIAAGRLSACESMSNLNSLTLFNTGTNETRN